MRGGAAGVNRRIDPFPNHRKRGSGLPAHLRNGRRARLRRHRHALKGRSGEVEALRKKYALSADLPSMRSIGYRQVWQHLEGELDRDELKDRAIYATRHCAKRQRTGAGCARGPSPLCSSVSIPRFRAGCTKPSPAPANARGRFSVRGNHRGPAKRLQHAELDWGVIVPAIGRATRALAHFDGSAVSPLAALAAQQLGGGVVLEDRGHPSRGHPTGWSS